MAVDTRGRLQVFAKLVRRDLNFPEDAVEQPFPKGFPTMARHGGPSGQVRGVSHGHMASPPGVGQEADLPEGLDHLVT